MYFTPKTLHNQPKSTQSEKEYSKTTHMNLYKNRIGETINFSKINSNIKL